MDQQCSWKCLILLSFILLVSNVRSALVDPVVSRAPQDVVQGQGGNAHFFCKITANPQTEAVQWTRTARMTGIEEVIYKTFNPKPIDQTKYNFTQTAPLETDILVKKVGFQDAGRYKCAPMTETNLGKVGELVVVEKPLISIPEKLEVGKLGSLRCDIFYMRSDNQEAKELSPQLLVWFGNDRILTDNVVQTSPTQGDMRYTITLNFTIMIQKAHDGKHFTCGAQVQRSSPSPVDFELYQFQRINVDYTIGPTTWAATRPTTIPITRPITSPTPSPTPRSTTKGTSPAHGLTVEITPGDTEITRSVGSSVELQCTVHGLPADIIPSITWYANGNEVSHQSRVFVQSTRPHSKKLYIFDIEDRDGGTYWCEVSNGGDVIRRAVSIVVFTDITFDHAPKTQYPWSGTDALIQCEASGDHVSTVWWRKMGEVIKSGGRYVYEPAGLRIYKITRADTGLYTCVAEVAAEGHVKETMIKVIVR